MRFGAQKSWAMVTAALGQLPMQLFMMWMSGSSIQIFSIMFLGMTFYNSFKNLVSVNHSAPFRAPFSPCALFFLTFSRDRLCAIRWPA